ncbi:uncharacterized protein J3D65DRAFT_591897 [Phyllosticta citribraziliensis]|uniref:Uncharacterized protein n=1 Tax=Phyllosticta citribraziliensis TaxID=989973 RepID=A0ABR1LIL9_9PEZI
MAQSALGDVDTVIVGNGPSALILSYILHGHIPYYSRPHHDALLHAKLESRRNLLDLTPDLYDHFRSSLRYSTQALPVNVLLDTLVRPNADTEISPESCVEWRYEPDKAVPHIALGTATFAGGQWAEDSVETSSEIGTLSYAEMLSLPGYSFPDHWQATYGKPLPQFLRPTRAQVASYYRAYPQAVGIAGSIRTGIKIQNVSRTTDGFYIGSHNVCCKHLVLASGIFTANLAPPPLLAPISRVKNDTKPLLVVGSGFSAADVILSTPSHRKIIHLFRWAPEDRPSPLRGCHHQAYPEYATIYRQMKLAALNSCTRRAAASPLTRKKKNPFFSHRDWASVYEGFANAEVQNVVSNSDCATVTLRLESGEVVDKEIGDLQYVVGRRGSLDYLEPALRDEVLTNQSPEPHHDLHPAVDDAGERRLISGRTLRVKAETDLEVAPQVFIIGSLTGDSLVRHAFGGCAYAAGRILDAKHEFASNAASTLKTLTPPRSPIRNGVAHMSGNAKIAANGTGHQDLHLDRRKLGQTARRKGSGWHLAP